MVKISSQSDKRLRRKNTKVLCRQTNKQTDPNAIPSPSVRVTTLTDGNMEAYSEDEACIDLHVD